MERALISGERLNLVLVGEETEKVEALLRDVREEGFREAMDEGLDGVLSSVGFKTENLGQIELFARTINIILSSTKECSILIWVECRK